MKLTQSRKVGEIVRPLVEGVPSTPCVGLTDPVMRAVELMLKKDLSRIAVSGRYGVIGHLRLEDALRHLGLHLPPSTSSFTTDGNRPTHIEKDR